jgi:hypothetical protein
MVEVSRDHKKLKEKKTNKKKNDYDNTKPGAFDIESLALSLDNLHPLSVETCCVNN